MNKETLTRAQIAKLIMASYTNRSILSVVFAVLWGFGAFGVFWSAARILLEPKDDRAMLAIMMLPLSGFAVAILILMTCVIIKRTKRWNARKRELENGNFYELREVSLREVVATPKAFDKCSYTMYFDGCSAYDVPDDNYSWSKTKRMSAETMYKNAKAGEKYYALIREESQLLIAVFSTKHFEIEE